MKGYLNPVKIVLLIVMDLYIEDVLPIHGRRNVLDFLSFHIFQYEDYLGANFLGETNQEMRWTQAHAKLNLQFSLRGVQRLLAMYPLGPGLNGTNLFDAFMAKLWDIDGLASFHMWFETLGRLVVDKYEIRWREEHGLPNEYRGLKFDVESPFGRFIRDTWAEYRRLPFDGLFRLWMDLVRYRQSSASYLKNRLPNLERLSDDNLLMLGDGSQPLIQELWRSAWIPYKDMLMGPRSKKMAVSTFDLDRMLNFMVDQLQEHGNRLPIAPHQILKTMMQDSPTSSAYKYYFMFMDAWRSGDFTSAMENIHRYYDYTMMEHGQSRFQHALMNKSMLLTEFCVNIDCVLLMVESIVAAREQYDETCLNYALNWLFTFGRRHPGSIRHIENDPGDHTGFGTLNYLRDKARDNGMWGLWAQTFLSHAQLRFNNGDTNEHMLEMWNRGFNVVMGIMLVSMVGPFVWLRYSMSERLGMGEWAIMMVDAYVEGWGSAGVFEDELRMACRQARINARAGRYAVAFRGIDRLGSNPFLSWKPNAYREAVHGLLKIRRLLYHENLEAAGAMIPRLLQEITEEVEPELTFDVYSLEIDYLVRKRKYHQALRKTMELGHTLAYEDRDVGLQLRVIALRYTVLSEMSWVSGVHRGFEKLDRALITCFLCTFFPELCLFAVSAGRSLSKLGHHRAARYLMDRAVWRAFLIRHHPMAGDLYHRIGDAFAGMASQTEPHVSFLVFEYWGWNWAMKRACDMYQKALEYYWSVEDVRQYGEVLLKKAALMRVWGGPFTVLSRKYAEAFKVLQHEVDLVRKEDVTREFS